MRLIKAFENLLIKANRIDFGLFSLVLFCDNELLEDLEKRIFEFLSNPKILNSFDPGLYFLVVSVVSVPLLRS